MKKNNKRLVSILLLFAFLISTLSVFTFFSAAEEEGEGGLDEDILVLYNRTFDEGWNYENGLTTSEKKTHNYSIDHEVTTDYSYNYFLRAEAGSTTAGYVYFNFAGNSNTALSGGTVIEFSIKADDVCAGMGNIMTGYTRQKKTINILSINALGELIAFPSISAANSATKCTHDSSTIVNGYCAACDKCDHTVTEGNTCLGCGANWGVKLGKIENEWLNIALLFDWGAQGMPTPLKCKILWGENYENSADVQFGYDVFGDKAITQFRMNIPAGTDDSHIGKSYCIDNLSIYQNAKAAFEEPLDIPEDNYGQRVDANAVKTIEILQGTNVKTKNQILEEALIMKLGVGNALVANEKTYIAEKYGIPVLNSGNVMIPLELLLDYIGYPYYLHPDGKSYDITTGTSITNITLGRDNAAVDNQKIDLSAVPGVITNADKAYSVIALEDVEKLFPGMLTVYDDMGLIVIYEDVTRDDDSDNEDIVNRTDDLDLMLDFMKKFLFDTVEEAKLTNSYVSTGNKIYENVKAHTNDFSHPYILTNQSTFDSLKAAYASGENEALKANLQKIVDDANANYEKYAKVEGGQYKGIKDGMTPVNVYSDFTVSDTNPDDTPDGYDPVAGRLEIVVDYTEWLPNLAFAYQITGDKKYAQLAYDWCVALADWTHWGPGYFTDCAEATANIAITYDWLYNIFKEIGNPELIAQGIYALGVHDGYVSASGKVCEHARSLGDQSGYTTLSTSSNAVGSAGMIIGSMAIFDYLELNEKEKSEAIFLLGNNLINIGKYGLDQYAPDGSYIESATYWNYGTNYFFKLVMALMSATGDDYGLMDTWGIETTCYYAVHIENSDGYVWNYHDGGGDGVTTGELSTIDSSMFFFVGSYYSDSALIAIRQNQLAAGKPGKVISIYDLLYYPTEQYEAPELPLTYYMPGIDAFVSRSDWEEGARYVGLMGGQNDASHGHLDSGNFIYQDNGIFWFMDLGSENYNVYDYFGVNRYKHYRVSAEGHNVVILEGNDIVINYGQYPDSRGVMTTPYTNEYGSYAIVDNTNVYFGNASAATRGMLVTNNGNTIVLQDELDCNVNINMIKWVAHTAATSIQIDETGKFAYLSATDKDGNERILRAALVTPGTYSELKFTFEQDTETPLLSSTYVTEDSVNLGGEREYGRVGVKRLIIESTTTMSLKVAVVLEYVESVGDTSNVGYTWAAMNSWKPVESTDNSVQVDTTKRQGVYKGDIKTSTNIANTLIGNADTFNDAASLKKLYNALTTVQYTLDYYEYDRTTIPTAYAKDYNTFSGCKESYDEFVDYVKVNVTNMNSIITNLYGATVESETEAE